MVKIYRHKNYYYEFESATRFIDVEYVTNEDDCDYVAVACSDNQPVFENINKPIVYSYIREHPYEHDEYLQTQFKSLKPTQDITIFSLSSFDYFAPNRKNIIIDQFELDAYHRLFVKKECETIKSNRGGLRFLFLGGKANKNPQIVSCPPRSWCQPPCIQGDGIANVTPRRAGITAPS